MVRRLVVRLVLCCVAIVGLLVAAGSFAGYLALRQPAFYADSLAVSYSPADQSAATQYLERCHGDVKRWIALSIAKQRVLQSGNGTAGAAAAGPVGGQYDPLSDSHHFRVTEQQINALLAAKKSGLDPSVRNPRICIGQDCIELGFGVQTSKAEGVLSAVLEPTVTDAGDLRLDIQRARIGMLPLPLQTILQWLPHEVAYSGPDLDLNLTPSDPHLVVKLPKRARHRPKSSRSAARPGKS